MPQQYSLFDLFDEHVYAYTQALLGWYFGKADFPMVKIRSGYFEGGLNMWATADI